MKKKRLEKKRNVDQSFAWQQSYRSLEAVSCNFKLMIHEERVVVESICVFRKNNYNLLESKVKCTEAELLGQFMAADGWSLVHAWLADGITTKNWHSEVTRAAAMIIVIVQGQHS